LLELPQDVQQSVRAGAISQGHARALLPLGDEHEQLAVCRRIVEEGLSVRAVESLIQIMIRTADAEPLGVVAGESESDAPPTRTRNQHLASLEQDLRTALGTKVDVRHGAKGRGRIVIHFASRDEYERLHTYLCGDEARPHSQAG
jgi:ParB family chromosome partitioning protein